MARFTISELDDMAKLTIAEQDDLFEKYDQLGDAQKTGLIFAMMEPYWRQNVPTERMERMRSNVIAAIIRAFCDNFESNEVNAWVSIASSFVPPFNDADINLVEKIAEIDEEHAAKVVYVAYYAHVSNPKQLGKKELPMPNRLAAPTLLNSPNVNLRGAIYKLLEDSPGLRYFHNDIEAFALKNKMTASEAARYELIKEKIAMLPEPQIVPPVKVERTPLSKEQIQFVVDMAEGRWVDSLPEDQSREEYMEVQREMDMDKEYFLKNTNSPEELHVFVQHHNWDDGINPIFKVIENKVCDRNTALLVFWLAQPTYYQQFDAKNLAPRDKEWNMWQFVRGISFDIYRGIRYREMRMPEDYKKLTTKQAENARWDIHDIMYGK